VAGVDVHILHIWLPIGAGAFFTALGLHSWQQRNRHAASLRPPPTKLEHSLSQERLCFFAADSHFIRAMSGARGGMP
jgi:hypothetical protein